MAETRLQRLPAAHLMETPVGRIPRHVIPFLYPSRYCQSDRLGRLARSKFGRIRNPFQKAAAISGWIYRNVQYLGGSTTWQTSACDTVTERAGVCRDFAHLGIALCRALSIPARYFTGYAHRLDPPDFHACFEAYVGRWWLLFDPTRRAPLNGLVRIATGRDAADASVATIFGPATCSSVKVSCAPLADGFIPLSLADLADEGLCLDAA
ncbi:MAG: transglutaminase-like domain-containing protein [Verrucomicrobiales bacterium]